jgi:hypothetical protein
MQQKKKKESPIKSEMNISELISQMSEEEIKSLFLSNPTVKNIISQEALDAANAAAAHEFRIFPEPKAQVNGDGPDMTGIEVVLPGTGFGKKKLVTKIVARHDFDTYLKDKGFMLKEEYDRMNFGANTIMMYSPDGESIQVPVAQQMTMVKAGFTLEKKKWQ